MLADRLPPVYLFINRSALSALKSRRLPRGIWGARLREPQLNGAQYLQALQELHKLLREGTKLVSDYRPGLVMPPEVDAIHLTSAQLMQAGSKPETRQTLIASTHNREQLTRAQATGIKHVTLSPVLTPRTSKPAGQQVPLGIETFGQLCRDFSELKIFGLGGITVKNMDTVLQQGGCFGLAGISLLEELMPVSR